MNRLPGGISLVMLPVRTNEKDGPLIVMLHWLSGSAQSWAGIMEACSGRGLACAAFDLPGFGDASDTTEFAVKSTVDAVIASIRQIRADRQSAPWFLAGHSMGGKFAAIVARRALDGVSGLEGLSGLILISPSPPGPEPMEESVRNENIDALGHSTLNAEEDCSRAESFLDANTGKLPLLEQVRERASRDILRMNRSAFVHWFTNGSKEDWSSRVGVIGLPVLLLSGTTESALGPAAQKIHTLPHFPRATHVELVGAGHLSPLERPAELADRMVAFVTSVGAVLQRPTAAFAPSFHALVESSLTSPQTRAVLKQRLADDDLPEPTLLDTDELLTLRAMTDRVIPGCTFDIAARVHRWLGAAVHDGWRYDNLPPDTEAWRIGLRSLNAASLRRHGVFFSALDAARQDELLALAGDGDLGTGFVASLQLTKQNNLLTSGQMNAWFSDVQSEITRIYVADPRTMQRIGFTGFADEEGFTQIRLNERERFEQ